LDPELQEVYKDAVDCFANEECISRKEDEGLEGLGMVIEGRAAGKGIDDHVNAFDFGPVQSLSPEDRAEESVRELSSRSPSPNLG
jgi:hypothetical protein